MNNLELCKLHEAFLVFIGILHSDLLSPTVKVNPTALQATECQWLT